MLDKVTKLIDEISYNPRRIRPDHRRPRHPYRPPHRRRTRPQRRHQAARAITRLHNSGQPITFTAVAKTAGVSTSFLYQHSQLRAEITSRRTQHAPNGDNSVRFTRDSRVPCVPNSPPQPTGIGNWQNKSHNSPPRIRHSAATYPIAHPTTPPQPPSQPPL